MSTIETIPVIMARIKKATPSSSIAIFVVTKNKVRSLKAIFYNTVECQNMITESVPLPACKECGVKSSKPVHEYLGRFHNEHSVQRVRSYLEVSL